MITLTTPIQVPDVLGSGQTVGYDKVRIVSIIADPVSMTISAQVQLMVSSNPNQPMITGTLTIVATGGSPSVSISIPNLHTYWGAALTGAQVSTVQGWITGLQNSVEGGIVSVGGVAGTQSAGV